MIRFLFQLLSRLISLCLVLVFGALLIGQSNPKRVIAFIADEHGDNKLYLMDVIHNRTHKLIDQRVASCCISWSPDGRYLVLPVFDGGQWGLYRMKANGDDLRFLTREAPFAGIGAVWSPDGKQVAFFNRLDASERDNDIAVTDFETGVTRQLTDNTFDDRDIIWSPNGQYLLFTSHRNNIDRMYRINLQGGVEQPLLDTRLWNIAIAFSPDGKSLLVHLVDERGFIALYLMNADGSGQRRLTDDGQYTLAGIPSFSPDGRQIVYESNPDGDTEIYILNMDDRQQRQLTFKDSAHDAFPAWSPDGQQILFVSHEYDGNIGIYVMDADGQNQRLVVDNPVLGTFPVWQP
jgi:TolB protein